MSLLARWDELREQGHEAPIEQLGNIRPEIMRELRIRIEQLKAMDWLDFPGQQPSRSPEQTQTDFPQGPGLGELRIPPVLGGRYELQTLIAEGGFGQVWRAVDTSLQRPVAVKVTTVNCFSEARRVARLRHHGIVAVHDVGNEDGWCYIVFDLVEGTTLAQKIKEGNVTWQESAQLIAQVAESVQFAHEKGFIHRDINPSNILIDLDGQPVLADFGIAVTECELRHEAITCIGTLAYMAPEQLQVAGQIDARTDVYGLGVVLYELLTGQRPFSNPIFSRLREEILTADPVSPRTRNSTIPDKVETIVLKCLSRAMDQRYSTAKSLADALRQLD